MDIENAQNTHEKATKHARKSYKTRTEKLQKTHEKATKHARKSCKTRTETPQAPAVCCDQTRTGRAGARAASPQHAEATPPAATAKNGLENQQNIAGKRVRKSTNLARKWVGNERKSTEEG
eukprot:4721404-Pleurochrysis_carterae.AAC.4